MVNSTRAETALYDLEATSLAEDKLTLVDADVIEGDMAMAVRSIVKTNDRQHALDGNTWGVRGHEND